jgi:hypothetical protein
MPLVSDGDGAHAPDDPSEGTRNTSAQYDPQKFVELSRFCRAWVYGLEFIANRLVEGQRDDTKEALCALVLGFVDKELDLLDVRFFPHFSKVIAAEMKGAANTELRITGRRPIIEHTAHLVVRDLMQDFQSEIFRRTVDKTCTINDAWFDANYDRICDVIRTWFGDRDTQVELDRLAAQLASECSTIEMANPKTLLPSFGMPDPRTKGSGEAVEDGQPRAEWPPDDGWHFQPGGAAFNGKVFEIAGQSWKLLRMFAEKGQPVSWTEISEHLASDPNIQLEKENVKVHVSDLRTILRRHFDCGKSDPIPRVDRGQQLAWRLDHSALQPHSKSV